MYITKRGPKNVKLQGVLGLSFNVSSISYSTVTEVSVEGRVSLKDLCPFFAGDMSSSSDVILCPLIQGRTNPGLQVAMATKFCRWRPIFAGSQYGPCFKSPSWRLECWLLHFCKIGAPLQYYADQF